ncbi:MAG: hypothetical protein AABX29_01590 [Nanoarchaeota archaeon]
MEQETKRVKYETRTVYVPGLGQHAVLELVEVPYDLKSAPSAGLTQTDVKQGDNNNRLRMQHRVAEIGDLV